LGWGPQLKPLINDLVTQTSPDTLGISPLLGRVRWSWGIGVRRVGCIAEATLPKIYVYNILNNTFINYEYEELKGGSLNSLRVRGGGGMISP
jgi:hypothetical protein